MFRQVMFDATSIPTPQSLRQCLADKLEFPLERLVLAKHFPDKFDWLIIKAMPAQVCIMVDINFLFRLDSAGCSLA